MKNIKYLITIITLSLIFPLISNAATISLKGDKADTLAEYTISYESGEKPVSSVTLKLITENKDLKYEIEPAGNFLKCDDKLECILITTNMNNADIGKLIIKNPTSEEIKTTITLKAESSDDIIEGEGLKQTFTLKGFPKETTTTTKPKSNNSNMTGITFSVGVLDKNFDPNVTEYTVTGIKDTINSVTLTPTCENCEYTVTCPTGGCSVSNSKRVTLETGANNVAVNIKSEDGTSNKTYTFNVYRGDIITSSPYLKEIKIKDATLSPKFDSLTNDYSCILKKDLEKLDITVTPEDPTADIQIKGNEKLKLGENTITITVTSSDGENKQVYQILVTKEKEDNKTTKKIVTSKVNKKKNNKWLILLLSILALIIIIVAFILIFKKKKNKKNDNNDKNDKGSNQEEKEIGEKETPKEDENNIIKENTDALNILEETRKEIDNEEKTDIDEALDDLMQTKKLELGDLDLYK